MPTGTDRATVNQLTQIGMEVTPGTSVAATKLLESTTIEPGIKANFKEFKAQGRKRPFLVVPGKEWTESKLTGAMCYAEIIYWLSSAKGAISSTLHTAGTISHDWNWTDSLQGNVNIQTFTIESGDSVRAGKSAYNFVNDWGWKVTRDACDFSGGLTSQAYQDNITLTPAGGVAPIGAAPILPEHWSFYLDTTSGGIGGTQLVDVMSAEFQEGSIYGTFWPLNRTLTSFSKHIDLGPKTTFKLAMEADSVGMSPLAFMRLGSSCYIRAQAQGPFIEGAIPYVFQQDMAVKVSGIQPFADEAGVYKVEWTFTPVEDTVWTKSYSILVTNGLTTL